MSQGRNRVLLPILALTALFTAACGSGGSSALLRGTSELEPAFEFASSEIHAVPAPQPESAPGIHELEALLYAELERLGIDPQRTASQAPLGDLNEIFDMAVRQTGPAAGFPEEEPGFELSWTERMVGDYDQNGEVGISDLTPLALYFNGSVAYDPAEDHGGIGYWPTGDPDAGGADNWRASRVDGDVNGEINLGDIAAIAQHWGERIDGYQLYWREPGAEEFTVLPNLDDPEEGVTVPRSVTFMPGGNAPDPALPVRYRFFVPTELVGEHAFTLAPRDALGNLEGNWCDAQGGVYNSPPVAALSADPLTVEYGGEIEFDASASTDSDGAIVLYEWDLDGDGEFDFDTGDDPLTSYTFDASGDYESAVRVTDDLGATDTATVSVTMQAPIPPVADLTAGPLSGNVPLTVDFDASLSVDHSGGGLTYDWDFDGDGEFELSTGGEATVRHVYFEGGEFMAAVRVTDGNEQTDTADVTITTSGVIAAEVVIMPDPDDADWLGVLGSGTETDPYVVADYSEDFNADFAMEFGLVAYALVDGEWIKLDNSAFSWQAMPPFIVDWTGPGVFKANQFTSEYIFAIKLDILLSSNEIYVVAHFLPGS